MIVFFLICQTEILNMMGVFFILDCNFNQNHVNRDAFKILTLKLEVYLKRVLYPLHVVTIIPKFCMSLF